MSVRTWIRTLAVLGIPALLLVLAASIADRTGSGLLYGAVVLALVVIAAETLRDLDHSRNLVDVERDIVDIERRRADIERRKAEQTLESRRIFGLLAYVGDTTPTLVELSRSGTDSLDGWLGMVSDRIAHACSSADAGIMVLREVVVLESTEFAARYEVVNRGGSRSCTLSAGVQVRAHEGLTGDLRREAGAGSVYLTEFTINRERYWLGILLSATGDHPALMTLCRIMVSPVVASSAPHSPADAESASDLATARAINRLNSRRA